LTIIFFIKVGIKGDDLYVDLLLYERGLVNVPVGDNDGIIAPNIHDEMEKLGLTKHDEVYADSAEAKSIMELQLMDWNMYPVTKRDGSILEGIDILRRYKIHITNRSEGMKLEARNYKWMEDKDGELMNKPVDKYNDAWDAIRYVGLMKLAVEDEGFFMQYLN